MIHLKQVQSQMIVTGLCLDGLAYSRLIAFSALSPMGDLNYSKRLLFAMQNPNAFSWNIVIRAICDSQNPSEAFLLYKEMLVVVGVSLRPDNYTFPLLFKTCAKLLFFQMGYEILGHVFNANPGRNALTYTAIIGGLALHGDAQDALSYFLEMIDAGLTPDEVTFLGVLSACCHGGLVEEGRKIFSQMSSKFNIPPQIKHYSCMVDLLGRAGLLKEAIELLESMPIEADAVVWGAMFFACRIHKNIELGERAAMKLLDLDPDDSGIYVLLANMYVEANMWDKAGKVRKMMRERGVDKTPGCSSIEVNGNLYEFIVRDKSHSQSNQIYECLVQLSKQMELVECVVGVPHPKDEFLFSSEVGSWL
ncbi:Pentatricopeptide repeat-containing protein, mitochondrial [Sesamum alatum]|uniref:Pentatricopeptide repeat-containing protein, mitochondrial n=1 Tax=Sesamum alatum TaxID=300844 RepID=A0AAE1Z424_9LAMI|nr:Pentatricopeptide repeat-containing protein, mitochondrial [Sesamum alatum]